MEKVCSNCKLAKPLESYNKDKDGKFGLKGACRECQLARVRARYHENLEKSRADNKRRYHNCKQNIKRKPGRKQQRVSNPAATALWQKNNPEKVNAKTARRQAKLRGSFIEDVDVVVLGERDGWVCQLCSQPVDPECKGRTSNSRSIDHIVPVSRGGEHSYANTQLAHFGCNSRKHARL